MRHTNFGSINYTSGDVPPLRRTRAKVFFDYETLFSAVGPDWQLAGEIGKRINKRGQNLGGRLFDLWEQGRIERAIIKTEIYWRKKCTPV